MKTIYVIEDTALQLKMLNKSLMDLGHTVYGFKTGEEFFAFMADRKDVVLNNHNAVIITDYNLDSVTTGAMNGGQVTRRLRGEYHIPVSIPIIGMSAADLHRIGGDNALPIFREAGATIAINKGDVRGPAAWKSQLEIATAKAMQIAATKTAEVQNRAHHLSEDGVEAATMRLQETEELVSKRQGLLPPIEDSRRYSVPGMENSGVLALGNQAFAESESPRIKKCSSLDTNAVLSGDRIPTRRGSHLVPINYYREPNEFKPVDSEPGRGNDILAIGEQTPNKISLRPLSPSVGGCKKPSPCVSRTSSPGRLTPIPGRQSFLGTT